MEVTFLTNEDEKNILAQAEAGKLLYTAQTLSNSQKRQARGNIGAAPAGYGFGDQYAAAMPGNDANNAYVTGVYAANRSVANLPADALFPCILFVQANGKENVVQMLYNTDSTMLPGVDIAVREGDAREGKWGSWKWITNKEKIYEKIATITVAPGADGTLPKHVIFAQDSSGNPFQLTDFLVKAYAGFVDGSKSTLYMNVNGGCVIANGTVGSISSSYRSFNIFFRQEGRGFKRVEYTNSMMADGYFNAQAQIQDSRLIPPTSTVAALPVTSVDLYTE